MKARCEYLSLKKSYLEWSFNVLLFVGVARGEGDGADVPATLAAAVHQRHETKPTAGGGPRYAGHHWRAIHGDRHIAHIDHFIVLGLVQEPAAAVVTKVKLQRPHRHRLGSDE